MLHASNPFRADLKCRSNTELQQPGKVGLIRDHSEGRTADVRVRRAEIRSICGIERLRPELRFYTLFDGKGLEDGEVQVE
jgi:hypothetical protein